MTGREKSYDALGDMMDELRRLREETHPQRQPGEFTTVEYANAQNPPLDITIATAELDYMVKSGKVIKIESSRFIDGRMRVVYKLP